MFGYLGDHGIDGKTVSFFSIDQIKHGFQFFIHLKKGQPGQNGLSGTKGEKGNSGMPGLQGPIGLTGKDGQNGNPGNFLS